jgi:membrane protein
MRLGDVKQLIVQTVKDWQEDKASRLAAALSYYTVFSLPPLLIIALAVAGRFVDRKAAEERILVQATGLVGETGAGAIGQILENASDPDTSTLAVIFSVVALLLGASGVFNELQGALNTMWEVEPKPGRGILGVIQQRFLSLTIVLVIGFMLLVSLILSAALAVVSDFFSGFLPESLQAAAIVSFVVSTGATVLLFAAIFKIVPDVHVRWRDVWTGAIVTTVLFTLGRLAIGIYLGNSATASTYGAAASLVVVMIWVYYSAQILFLGAEFTQAYARMRGQPITPDEDAVAMTEEARIQQGLASKETVQRKEAETEGETQPAAPPAPPRTAPGAQDGRRAPLPAGPPGPVSRAVRGFHRGLVGTLGAAAALWYAARDALGRRS